jgi:hypothetical protein
MAGDASAPAVGGAVGEGGAEQVVGKTDSETIEKKTGEKDEKKEEKTKEETEKEKLASVEAGNTKVPSLPILLLPTLLSPTVLSLALLPLLHNYQHYIMIITTRWSPRHYTINTTTQAAFFAVAAASGIAYAVASYSVPYISFSHLNP